MIPQTEIQIMKHGTRILVVEDEIIIAEDIQKKLKKMQMKRKKRGSLF